jgi:two-component system response regulator
MRSKVILLVEDNPDDVALALRAFKINNIVNDLKVIGDGEEALDFLFARGIYAGRVHEPLPEVVLLDLKLPKVDGLEVLRQIRACNRTRLLPVVILTSSREERDVVAGVTAWAATAIFRNRSISASLRRPSGSWVCIGWC